MSKKGSLSREQAISIAGEEAVTRAEGMNCEPTGRVGYNGNCQGDDSCEWRASVRFVDKDGVEDGVLEVYYYTSNEEDQAIADAGDGSVIDWHISGYQVI